jgi:hypothetical protein
MKYVYDNRRKGFKQQQSRLLPFILRNRISLSIKFHCRSNVWNITFHLSKPLSFQHNIKTMKMNLQINITSNYSQKQPNQWNTFFRQSLQQFQYCFAVCNGLAFGMVKYKLSSVVSFPVFVRLKIVLCLHFILKSTERTDGYNGLNLCTKTHKDTDKFLVNGI